MFLCRICYHEIDDQFFTKCRIAYCTGNYAHNTCAIRVMSIQHFTNWICPECRLQLNYGLVQTVGSYSWTQTTMTNNSGHVNNMMFWSMSQPAVVEPHSQSQPQRLWQHQPQRQWQRQTQPRSQPQPQPQPRPQTEPQWQLQPLTQPQRQLQPLTQPQRQLQPLTQPLPQPQPQTEPQPHIQALPQPLPQPQPQTEPQPHIQALPQPLPQPLPHLRSRPQPLPQPMPSGSHEANYDNTEAGPSSSSSSSTNLNAITEELRELRLQLVELHERFDSLNTSLSHERTTINDVFSPLGTSEAQARQVSYFTSQILALKNQMARFHESLSYQVEMVGIPEREREDTFGMVELAARKMGIPFHETDIDWATRLATEPISENIYNYCRPLVVRFGEKTKRDLFLRIGKATKNLTTIDLNVNCRPRRVFIHERLSRDVRCLFHEARFHSRVLGFKFCWIQNSTVFVRRNESTPPLRLLNQQDLNNMVGDDLTPELENNGDEDESD